MYCLLFFQSIAASTNYPF